MKSVFRFALIAILGSAALACAELGIDFLGIEIDEHYLKESVARVKSLGSS